MSRDLTLSPGFFPTFARKGGANPNVTHYCPGCGHGILHKLIAEALVDLDLLERAVFISPVGCSVFGYYYFHCGNIQAAHGRAPAVATAVKRAHPSAIVISYQGDGDLAAIGGNNILHAANRGENFTTIFVNNAIYGMTGGQMAPTTLVGQPTSTSPGGRDPSRDGHPIRICELLATLDGPAYLERCALDTPKHILRTRAAIRRALRAQIEGRGFSLVEVLSLCPTGWDLDPVDAQKFVGKEMAEWFPLGIYADRHLADAARLRRPRGTDARSLLLNEEAAIDTTAPPGSVRLILSGFGGQGALFLGKVVAQLGMAQGRQVSWLPSYGPEMRGGTAHCHVILSDLPIGSPIVSAPDVLVALNAPSLERFSSKVPEGGLILCDASEGDRDWAFPGRRTVPVPFAEIANRNDLRGRSNLVALGALNALMRLFPDAAVEALLAKSPDNLAAYRLGRDAAPADGRDPDGPRISAPHPAP